MSKMKFAFNAVYGILALAAVMLLSGCINPFEPQTAQPKAGTGYFALSINGNGGRTIQPKIVQDDFTQYLLEFFLAGQGDNVIRSIPLSPDQLSSNQLTEFIELPVGDYDLTVTAYMYVDGENKAAARGSLLGIEIKAGNTSGGNVKLNAIEEGYGTFSWDIDYPEGTTAEIFIDSQPFDSSGQTAPTTLYIKDTPEGEAEKAKKDSIELRSGTYRVTFKLVNKDDRSLEYSEILQVYQNLTSHFGAKDGGTEVFTEDYFIIKRVTKIELTTSNVETGIELPLNEPNVKISPDGATFKDIVWSIGRLDENENPDPKNTGAEIDEDGVFYSLHADDDNKANATVYVLATVEHGKGYGIDYVEEIAVTVEFVQVTGISLENELPEGGMEDNTEFQIEAKVEPPNATIPALEYTSNNTVVATVDKNTGLITAKRYGTTAIQVKSVSNPSLPTEIFEVIVKRIYTTNITMSAEYVYLPRTGPTNSTTLKAVIAPVNASEKGLSWVSSDTTRITVNQQGYVSVVGGTPDMNEGAKITVTNSGGAGGTSITAECFVVIVSDAGNVTDIELNINSVRLEVGKSAQLIPFILPEGEKSDMFWVSGDPGIASVISGGIDPTPEDGTITAHKAGTVEITVTTLNGGRVAECLVEVYDPDPLKPAVTGLTLSPTNFTGENVMSAGYPDRITATITPSDAANQNLVWKSSNEWVAEVDQDGQVNPKNPGNATITVTTEDSGIPATCDLTVKHTSAESVELNITDLMMTQNRTATLTATVYPFNATDKSLQWSSDNNNIAEVDQNGNVTYKVASGETTIRVKSLDNPTDPACNKACLVRLRTGGTAVNGVSLTTNKLRVAMGQTARLNVYVSPTNAEHINALTWHPTDKTVATVNAIGVVTPVKPGKLDVIVMSQDGGYSDTCEVEVYEGSMANGIILNTDTLTLTTSSANGRTAQLIATVTPDGASQAVTWISRNTAIATVDANNGLVTAVAAGTAVITATSVEGGHMKMCTVTVQTVSVGVSGLRLSTNALDLEVGTIAAKPITVYDGRTSVIKWYSVNNDVATVNDNGLVSAKAVGNTTIIATSVNGGFRANVAVRVRATGEDAPAVTGVELNTKDKELNTNAMTLFRSRTATLQAFIKPVENPQSESAAANKNVYWSSSDTTIATVNATTGLITALTNDGTVTIMATTIDGGYTDTCTVTVKAVSGTAVTGLALNMQYLTLNMRSNPITFELRTGTIRPTVYPSNATTKELVWYNSNPAIATVDTATGTVTAQALGKTIIQITTAEGGYTQRVEVHVVPAGVGNTPPDIQAVNTVTMPLLSKTIYAGGQLTATVNPENAASKDIAWSSSNTAVATMTSTGRVVGISRGTAVITATTVDGGKTTSCTITVLSGTNEEVVISGHSGGNFRMGKYEVTQDAYRGVAGSKYFFWDGSYINHPDYGNDRRTYAGDVQGRRPADSVSWVDAVCFCNLLSIMDDLTPVYNNLPPEGTPRTSIEWNDITIVADANGYRLPTRSQWRHAAFAGATTTYPWGTSVGGYTNYAWFNNNSERGTHEVGKKNPNAWGLYDMMGNVWEWCWDFLGYISYMSENVPIRALQGSSVEDRSSYSTGGTTYYASVDDRGMFRRTGGSYGIRVIRPAP